MQMREKAGAKELERKAWLTNGYASHLQDSFAAGHLINKTLVMQWFAEYVLTGLLRGKRLTGVPGTDVLGGMTEQRQPDLGDRRMYNEPRLHTSASEAPARRPGRHRPSDGDRARRPGGPARRQRRALKGPRGRERVPRVRAVPEQRVPEPRGRRDP